MQKLGLKLLGSDFMRKAATELPASVLRAMNGFFGISGPVYQIDNPEAYIKLGYHQNAIVYQVVSWIIGKAAMVDFGVRAYRNGELLEEIDQHPLIDLIYNPNPLQGKQEFLEQAFGYYLITGNSYVYAPRLESGQNQGKTLQLNVLPAHFTEVITSADPSAPIAKYKVDIGQQTEFEANDVMHWKMTNLWWENGESYYGASPLRAGARTLQKSNSNEDAAVALFQNMGLRGILSQDTKEDAWTSEQVQQAERSFYRKFGGSDKAGRVMITNTAVRWQDVGLSPVDMALLEDHLQNLRSIASIYKVSSRLFNDPAASTYNNMEQDARNAYTNAIMPMIKGFVDNFNRWLCPAYEENGITYKLYPITDNIPELQKDLKGLSEWLGNAWWLEFNEKRLAMGFDEDPKMAGKYYIPANFIPSDEDQLNFDEAARAIEDAD